jgi:hypothetical protein
MLKPGGVLIMHDFTYPAGGLFLRLWKFYFRILQSAGARVFPEWKTAFDELPAFLESTRWVDDLVSSLKDNGFEDIRVERLFMKTAAIVVARTGLDSRLRGNDKPDSPDDLKGRVQPIIPRAARSPFPHPERELPSSRF